MERRLRIKVIALSLALTPLIWSCSKTPTDESQTTTPTLTVAPDRKEVSWQGNTYGVGITSTSSWVIESKPAWVECMRYSGTTNQPFDYTVATNEGGSREGVIRLYLADHTQVTATITISQEAKPEDPVTPFLYIEPDVYNALCTATTFSCTVEASTDWDFYPPMQDWVSLQKHNNTLQVSVSPNESVSSRSQIVTLRLKDDSKTFGYRINQEGKEKTPDPTIELELDLSEINCTMYGDERGLIVTSSHPWKVVSRPDNVQVITHSEWSHQMGVTIKVGPSGPESMKGELVFRCQNVERSVQIIQHHQYITGSEWPSSDNVQGVVFWIDPSDYDTYKVVNKYRKSYYIFPHTGDLESSIKKWEGKEQLTIFRTMEQSTSSRLALGQVYTDIKNNVGSEWWIPSQYELSHINILYERNRYVLYSFFGEPSLFHPKRMTLSSTWYDSMHPRCRSGYAGNPPPYPTYGRWDESLASIESVPGFYDWSIIVVKDFTWKNHNQILNQ